MIALPVTSATATPGSPVRRAGSMNRAITSALIPSPTSASSPRSRATSATTTTNASAYHPRGPARSMPANE